MNAYKNWRLNVDENNIAWVYFDAENKAHNTLDSQAMRELGSVLDAIDAIKQPKGMVILSAKEKSFCMGADINEFYDAADPELIKQHLEMGQGILKRITRLPFPTVAVINGFCLGGGLELTLACRYRIGQSDDKTLMGLPEVRLGLLPAWGGTVRLTALVSPLVALPMMLSGKMADARSAKRSGLLDIIVPKRQLINAARYTILHPPKKRKKSIFINLFQLTLLRKMAAHFMRKSIAKHAKPEHYPAPYKILNNWQQNLSGDKPYQLEVKSFLELLQTHTARNLTRIFFLQEHLKSQGKQVKSRVAHVHVIGAGTMGGDIAIWCMLKGLKVTLQDRTPDLLKNAIKRAADSAKTQLKDPTLIAQALDRFIPDASGEGISHADVIIEAVFEDLAVKKALFKEVGEKAKETAIIASNTSSISLDDLKTALPNPDRLVGIHFFNPVAKMQLVEVVHTDTVLKNVLDEALAFVHQIGKLPLAVKNCPGFLVNRVVGSYLVEGARLVEEGVPIQLIDKAATDFGMVMGPIMTADLVGLDVCFAVAQNLSHEKPAILQEKIAKGQLGKKTGKGFYRYKNGKMQRENNAAQSPLSQQEILDRLLLLMLNESVACNAEKIAASSDDIDIGIILGMGFAPFLGGPMTYARHAGYEKLVEKLKHYEKTLGKRFKPSPGWETLMKL